METDNAERMSASQAFYFCLSSLEIPKQLLGKSRAVLELKMSRRFKIATVSSTMAAFMILALAFGRVLSIF